MHWLTSRRYLLSVVPGIMVRFIFRPLSTVSFNRMNLNVTKTLTLLIRSAIKNANSIVYKCLYDMTSALCPSSWPPHPTLICCLYCLPISANTSQAQACRHSGRPAPTALSSGAWTVDTARNKKKCQFSGPLPMTPKLFMPKTIPEVPWSYHENLEAIIAAVPDL